VSGLLVVGLGDEKTSKSLRKKEEGRKSFGWKERKDMIKYFSGQNRQTKTTTKNKKKKEALDSSLLPCVLF